MQSGFIKFINALYTTMDPHWKPTDNVPELAMEAFKEFYPVVVAIISAMKSSGA